MKDNTKTHTWVFDMDECGHGEDHALQVQHAFNELTVALQGYMTEKVQQLELEVIALQEENKILQRGLETKDCELHDQSRQLQEKDIQIAYHIDLRQNLATTVAKAKDENAKLCKAIAKVSEDFETLKSRYEIAQNGLVTHRQDSDSKIVELQTELRVVKEQLAAERAKSDELLAQPKTTPKKWFHKGI